MPETPFDAPAYADTRFDGRLPAGGVVRDVTFERCRFSACRFAGAAFRGCTFRECRFVDCDLSNLALHGSTLTAVTFERCKLLGVDWTVTARRLGLHAGFDATFQECVLDLGNFFGVPLPELRAVRCTLREADLREADLRRATLTGSDFAGSLFGQTNLEGADLTDATGYVIDPRANRVRGLRVSLPDAIGLLLPLEVEIA